MEKERYGYRLLEYSAWHRTGSIRRFVGYERAQLLSMVDADCALFLEFEPGSKEPLCLIETALDVGQQRKPATAITRLAMRAGIPAYLVLYERAETLNPADGRWCDVKGFRVRRLWPRPESNWRTLTPAEWANGLLQIRAWSARRLDTQAANDDFYERPPMQEQLFNGKR